MTTFSLSPTTPPNPAPLDATVFFPLVASPALSLIALAPTFVSLSDHGFVSIVNSACPEPV